ncbi:uncharacterized protein LOC133175300 [Saccostrea echinata]|uniref:uncharacterized protein LOC133175300 n=1 Tax=Saccostrea echinata TaxID=191078 RepID=UPI002A81DDFE|nr:uncharacterized protein LOC133175300 [Saccostrea echinata]
MPHGAIRFPFGKCHVCQDQATGVHYGVATCEGCKGFFKRSTIRGEKYKCFFGGQCEITPQNRNRCKSCRFRLCLESGMSLEAVKMGRIPKLEKERALELASQEGNLIEEININKKVKGQKNSDSKNSKKDLQETKLFYNSNTAQMGQESSFSIAKENHQMFYHSEAAGMPSRSFNCISPPNSEMFSDPGKHRMVEQKSTDSSSDSFKSDPLLECASSPEDGNVWAPHPSYPPTVFESSRNIIPSTSSSLPESFGMRPPVSIETSTCFAKFKTEFPPFSDSGTHRNPSDRTSSGSVEDWDHQRPCGSQSLHSSNHTNPSACFSSSHKERRDVQCSTASGSMDYDEIMKGRLFPTAEVGSFYDDRRNNASLSPAVTNPHYNSSSSNEAMVWENEILGKLQLNDNSFKTEINTSEVYSPIRNHYKYLCDVEQFGMYNRLPLYIRTLQQLDICQRNGMLLKLLEVPSDMIDKICKSLAMEDKYAVSKEGVNMGKDSTFLIQGTLLRLKHSMDLLWKPIWLMRQFIRQGLSNEPCSFEFTGVEEESMKENWPALMQSVAFYNDVIIGFAFACPGFRNLQPDLKEYLTKRAYFDIWVLTMADFCIDGRCLFPLPNGKVYTNCTMKKILKEKTFMEIQSVLEKINKCQLCDLEIGLMCAILLIDADDDNLTGNSNMNLEPLRTLHSHYLDILATVISKIHTTQTTKRLRDIFSLTPLIKKLSTRLQLQITSYGVEQIPDEDSLQTIAMNTEASVEKVQALCD